jgi:hypothetical protein
MELSGGTRLITLFDNDGGIHGPLYVTITNNLYEGSGSSVVHFRRDGGLLRSKNNNYSDGAINFTQDGTALPKMQIQEEIYVEVEDAVVSPNIAKFLTIGGFIVGIEDVTDFNLAFFGSAAYSSTNTPVAHVAYATNGANIIFRDFKPSALSAGNVQIGCNGSGEFAIRNDSGVTKTFRVTFTR